MKHIDVYGSLVPIVPADTYGDDVFPNSRLREYGYVPMRGSIAMRWHRHVLNIGGGPGLMLGHMAGEYAWGLHREPKYRYPGQVYLRYLRRLWARSKPAGAIREITGASSLLLPDCEPIEPLLYMLGRVIQRRFNMHPNSSSTFMNHLSNAIRFREYAGGWEVPPVTFNTMVVQHGGRVFLVDNEWIPDHLKASVSQLLQEIQETGMCYVETKQRVPR